MTRAMQESSTPWSVPSSDQKWRTNAEQKPSKLQPPRAADVKIARKMLVLCRWNSFGNNFQKANTMSMQAQTAFHSASRHGKSKEPTSAVGNHCSRGSETAQETFPRVAGSPLPCSGAACPGQSWSDRTNNTAQLMIKFGSSLAGHGRPAAWLTVRSWLLIIFKQQIEQTETAPQSWQVWMRAS